MNNRLFRQSALETLSSPEQLDLFLRVTRPCAWLALGALAAILCVVVAWSIFGSLTTTVSGTGILVRPGGMINIIASETGRVTDLANLKPGDSVRQGQVMGHVSLPVLKQEIHAVTLSLVELEQEKNALAKIASEANKTQLDNLQLRLIKRKNQLQDLEQRYQNASEIVSPYDAKIIEISVTSDTEVSGGQRLFSLERRINQLEAVIYLPAFSNGKRLQAGMPVHISPVTYKKERYGYLAGKIDRVSQYPATEAGMMAMLNNAALVRELSKQGPPIMVSVALQNDPETLSGYAWSSKAGRNLALDAGTPVIGVFIVEKKRPISLLLPRLEEAIGL